MQGHLDDDAARPSASTGSQPKKASGGGLGLRKLIAATQACHLRSKQQVSAAVKTFGDTQPHVSRT